MKLSIQPTTASILALAVLTGGASADTFIGDLTWTTGSVVTLDEDTIVEGTLTIEPGVTIQADPGVTLTVATGGTMVVNGTEASPSVFTSSSGRWDGMLIESGSVVDLEWAVIEKTFDTAVGILDASPVFTNTVIRDVRSSASRGPELTSPSSGEVINGGSVEAVFVTGAANPSFIGCTITDVEGGRGVSRTFRVTRSQAGSGSNGTEFNQDGGTGGTGLTGFAAYGAGDGGDAAGFRIEGGADATIRDSVISDIRGGLGGTGGKGGSGGRGGTGGNGAAFFSVGDGGNGGRGGHGVEGGRGGYGGDAYAVWADSPGASLRVLQNVIHDIEGGDAGRGGVGGSGAQGGTGGRGASTSTPFVNGGDGGNGGRGGNAAPGGRSGDPGFAKAIEVNNAASRAMFVQNTVARVSPGDRPTPAAAGSRGPGGVGGNGGSSGFGGDNGSRGSTGSLGSNSSPGFAGNPAQTRLLSASNATTAIQIQATNNIFSNSSSGTSVALYASGSAIIASDSNCYDGFSALNGGSGTGSLGFAFIVADPMFTDAANDDFTVMPGSPVIDAADSFQLLPFGITTDITGADRIFDDPDTANTGVGIDPVDMGAFEFRVGGLGCSEADLAEPFGTLNFFDLGAFLELFGQEDPAADLAAPFGEWNFFDLGEFLTIFGNGCP